MRHRFSTSTTVAVITMALLLLASAVGQTPVPAGATTAAEDGWTHPRTKWGDPDLQGLWTNETITPFERPENMADKKFLSAEEAAEIENRTAQRRAAADGTSPPGSVGAYNQVWMDSGTKFLPGNQTSLVVDPPNGRVPTKLSAESARDYNKAHATESYIYMSVWDRCISRGVPGSIFPAGYNNAYQILQTPEYLAIVYEMIHDVRIIPLDGRPHVDEKIRLWMGDSRAHWEGNTLVVETTNHTNKGWIASNGASRRIKGIPQSEKLHVVERFRRVSSGTIEYEVTIEDPEMYTRPWKVAMPLTRDNGYQMFEYACHEGNKAVALTLSGARNLEKQAAMAAKQNR